MGASSSCYCKRAYFIKSLKIMRCCYPNFISDLYLFFGTHTAIKSVRSRSENARQYFGLAVIDLATEAIKKLRFLGRKLNPSFCVPLRIWHWR